MKTGNNCSISLPEEPKHCQKPSINHSLNMRTMRRCLVLSMLSFAVTGCITDIRSASFAKQKDVSQIDTTNRNFRIGDVSVTCNHDWVLHDWQLKSELEKRECSRDSNCIPITYDVNVDAHWGAGNNLMEDVCKYSFGIIPGWATHSTHCEMSVSMPGVTCETSGKITDLDLYGWLFLPFQLIAYPFDNGPTDKESYIADAVSSLLTQERYLTAVSTMKRSAKQKLINGQDLSDVEERLASDFTDEESLTALAKRTEKEGRSRNSLDRIKDQKNILDIALNASDADIRKSAAMRVGNLPESSLGEVVSISNDPVVARMFLEKISEKAIFSKIVLSQKAMPEIRQLALAKINDENTLAVVAKAVNVDSSLKLAAANRIQSEDVLGELIRDSGDATIRLKALARVKDPSLLKRTAMSDASIDVRKAALVGIRDAGIVAEVARDNDSPEIRRIAILLIEEDAVLEKIAETECDEGNLLAILQKTANTDLFAKMAETAESAKVRAYSVGRLPEGEVVCHVAETDSDASVREIAIKKVSDPNVLARIAKSDLDPKLRLSALEKITDSETIKAIASSDPDAEVRRTAVAKIDDPGFLAQAASEDPDGIVNRSALLQSEEHGKIQLWEGGPYWAETNVGAETPWERGLYFWWGDTVGYRREGNSWVASDRSSLNFSFDDDNAPTFEKDISELQREGWIVAKDGTFVLAPKHDAGHIHCGGLWRMPTLKDLEDLENMCDWTSATTNGVDGYIVSGRGDYASFSIFLPATGGAYETSLTDDAESTGLYWSSVPYFHRAGGYLYFDSSGHGTYANGARHQGFPVRPVQRFAE